MKMAVRGLFLAGGLLVAACSAPQENEPAADVTLPSVEATESQPADESSPAPQEGDPATNDRGNIEVQVGAEMPLPDGGTVVFDKIEPIALPCPADNEFQQSTPQHGQFVRVDIRAATAPAGSGAPGPGLSSFNFRFIGSDGVTFNTDMGTFPAFSCLPPEQQFPSGPLGPGQQFTGTIVLDVPDPTGTLVFFPSGGVVGSEVGYEYTLGA